MAQSDELPYIVVERRGGSIAPFLWGAFLGAGLALLLAPRSGKETRREIRGGMKRLKETAEGTAREMQEAVTGTLGNVRREVSSRLDAARQVVDAGREAARETRAELQQRLADARHTVQTGIDAARRAGRVEETPGPPARATRRARSGQRAAPRRPEEEEDVGI
ncbi:MAG: YtxH domain-containing protein [Gemmatimonadetes bacterium]|nr:YtxH domain-containing protein [Gemmatimonadota bacterium]